METRRLGKTGFNVSVIGFGAWAIGADWGDVDDETSMKALHAAVDAGVTFFDTADAYGDGRSERLIARLRRERDEQIVVATKLGRRLPVQSVAGYSPENIDSFVARSQKNLETDCLDLVHCTAPRRTSSTTKRYSPPWTTSCEPDGSPTTESPSSEWRRR